MMNRAKIILSAAAIAAAAPVAALEAFAPPQGCSGTLTVQHHACLVTHIWTCEADAPGEKWMSVMNSDGPVRVYKVDDDFQWLETYSPSGTERLLRPSADPASLSELLETGVDTYDFTVTKEGGSERIVGTDRLIGTEVIIDEEPLLETVYSSDQVDIDGNIIESSEGHQFVSTRHRLFLFGRSWDRSNPDQVHDATPIEFIYPGEPGFFSTHPKFDCGSILSEYHP